MLVFIKPKSFETLFFFIIIVSGSRACDPFGVPQWIRTSPRALAEPTNHRAELFRKRWRSRPIPQRKSSHERFLGCPIGSVSDLRQGRGVAVGVVWEESRNKACIAGCRDTARAQVSPPPSAGIIIFIIFISPAALDFISLIYPLCVLS